MSFSIPENALSEFISEAEEILARVNNYLAKLESKNHSDDLIDSLYRDIHTLKGSAQLFGFNGIGVIGHALEACLEPVRSKKCSLSDDLINQCYLSLDLIDKIIKKPDLDLKKNPEIWSQIESFISELVNIATKTFQSASLNQRDPNILPDDLIALKKELNFLLPNSLPSQPTSLPKNDSNLKLNSQNTEMNSTLNTNNLSGQVNAKNKTESEGAESNNAESSTIRVQISLLDRLMNLIGEMVLVRNQVLQYSQKTDDYEFLNLSQRLDLVTSELQEDVMKTRMQPIGNILNKFQRVVRDISKELNKQIEFSTKGSETELDKSLIEAIKDPLTHIIRNSCDHGLETTEERKKAGKSEAGHLVVKSFHEGGQVVIEIVDDGRGLNLPKILSKAIQKKIITPEKSSSLTDREIAQLIFAPGFSTADQVSAISGRGVGMDVVKTNIEKVGGIVDLQTEMGKGTIIRLRIPLTLAIVPAMIVNSANQFFAIPQVKLQELVRIDMDSDGPKIEYLQGQPIYRLRGHLLPLVFINKVMNLNSSNTTGSSLTSRILNIVVLSTDGDPFGLVVDEIRDTADIVVKPLPHFLKRLNVYSGATIMGEGTVSLILDVVGVAQKANIQLAGSKKQENDNSTLYGPNQKSNDIQEFLFFELNDNGRYCLPLILVYRLEEFSQSDIEVSGTEHIVKYRNSILPLINLNEALKINSNSKSNKNEKISVIVVSKKQRLFGIVVNQIYDVIGLNSDIEDTLQDTPGILGNIIYGDSIATVVDVLNIIENVIGKESSLTPGSNSITKKINSNRRLRILLAEDTLFFAKHIMKVLNRFNVEIVHAQDGESAFKILKSPVSGNFDLVLSDIEMPNMNGFDLAKNIRSDSKLKDIPMIALTTRYKDSDIKKGFESGFNHYLEKLKPDQLIEAINNQLGGNVA